MSAWFQSSGRILFLAEVGERRQIFFVMVSEFKWYMVSRGMKVKEFTLLHLVSGHFPDGYFPDGQFPEDISPTDSFPKDMSPKWAKLNLR